MVLEKQAFLFLNIAHNSMKQSLSDTFRKGGFKLSPEQFLVMDTLWDEGVLNDGVMEEWKSEHMRTPYKPYL